MNEMNPLDRPGTVFDWAAMNPNPTASKTKLGPVYRVSFEVTQETWQMFMDSDTKGMVIAGKMFRAEDGETELPAEPEAKPDTHGKFWNALIAGSFFNAPPVLEAIGSDDKFLEWIRLQSSCVSGEFSESKDGEGRCQAAHVRHTDHSAGLEGGGTSIKPKYSAVPLTHEEHARQHINGELAAFPVGTILPVGATAKDAKEWFTRAAVKYRTEWARKRLARQFSIRNVEISCKEIPGIKVLEWCESHNLTRFVPGKAKGLAT